MMKWKQRRVARMRGFVFVGVYLQAYVTVAFFIFFHSYESTYILRINFPFRWFRFSLRT